MGELLELVVGLGSQRPAKNAGHDAFRGLVTPRHLVREVAVFLDIVRLCPLRPPVVAFAPIFAVATASATAPTALFLFALLTEPLEVEAVLGGVAVPIVVDTERTSVRLLLQRLRRVLPRLHWTRLGRENRGGLALGVRMFLARLGPLREVDRKSVV